MSSIPFFAFGVLLVIASAFTDAPINRSDIAGALGTLMVAVGASIYYGKKEREMNDKR